MHKKHLLWVIPLVFTIPLFWGRGDFQPSIPTCEQPGWFPDDFGLKDHTVFWHNDYYYMLSIHSSPETFFAYGRSMDLCDWEQLPYVLETGDKWDKFAIWAPFVWKEENTYYMVYTGVSEGTTQSIMLATTTDPSDASSWEKQGMIFQPHHENMVWEAGELADCRDPTVIKANDTYHLYYTGRDEDGGIVGMATADSPFGPWEDRGSILSPLSEGMPESPTIAFFDDFYFLFYFDTSLQKEVYRISPHPDGPWSEPTIFRGWANEIWQDLEDNWHTSYLTTNPPIPEPEPEDFGVVIEPVAWDLSTSPPRPFVGETIHHIFLPGLKR